MGQKTWIARAGQDSRRDTPSRVFQGILSLQKEIKNPLALPIGVHILNPDAASGAWQT
jgi:hypothetical protein